MSLAGLNATTLSAATLEIHADLREVTRGLVHVTSKISASPGPMTLLYPRWIPGEHGPTGPVADLAIIKISTSGKTLPWRRDLENMNAVHLDVPAGATSIDVAADYLAPSESGSFSAGPMASAKLAIVNWHLLTLYPQGQPASAIQVTPSLTLPEGWKLGTAMEIDQTAGATTRFKSLSLEMLIDQPVIAGANFKRFELSAGDGPLHVIDCAADSEAALAINAERLSAFQRVPAEYAALLGARFYRTYHFLLALSDRTGYNGVEHHQASDNRAPERFLVDDDLFLSGPDLLTHEFFHSWNGKHRRPAGLLSPDYQQPMHGDLLWVYEGLTNYYGEVLAVRAGLETVEQFHESSAARAIWASHQTGRTWRPLQDTADAAQILYTSTDGWSSRRRSVDFYDEGSLIWLEADVLIRTRSNGAKSLDDFARLFFGDGATTSIDPNKVPGREPSVVPYQASDIFAALNQIFPYDWKTFFTDRLNRLSAEPPLNGIIAGGWKLVRTKVANRVLDARYKAGKKLTLSDSLGLDLKAEDHTVVDVIAGLPADRAGVGPGMKIIGVNQRTYSDDVLDDALKSAGPSHPIELLMENAGYLSTLRLEYSDAPHQPHLERTEGPNLLDEILKPRAGN